MGSSLVMDLSTAMTEWARQAQRWLAYASEVPMRRSSHCRPVKRVTTTSSATPSPCMRTVSTMANAFLISATCTSLSLSFVLGSSYTAVSDAPLRPACRTIAPRGTRHAASRLLSRTRLGGKPLYQPDKNCKLVFLCVRFEVSPPAHCGLCGVLRVSLTSRDHNSEKGRGSSPLVNAFAIAWLPQPMAQERMERIAASKPAAVHANSPAPLAVRGKPILVRSIVEELVGNLVFWYTLIAYRDTGKADEFLVVAGFCAGGVDAAFAVLYVLHFIFQLFDGSWYVDEVLYDGKRSSISATIEVLDDVFADLFTASSHS